MHITANSGMSLSNFSNLLPSRISVIDTVKKSALLVLVLTTLPSAEALGTEVLQGIVTLARAAYPYITYAGCLATCKAMEEGIIPSPLVWSYEGCVRSCQVYRDQF